MNPTQQTDPRTRLLSNLNERQAEIVSYNESSQLVIAGAGSGKTRVLTYKIAYLLSSGYEPWQILALTFTNKAATEMKERIGALIGIDQARQLRMGTFHHVFAGILRMQAEKLGFSTNYSIYDTDASRSLVKHITDEMGLDTKIYEPRAVQARISRAKNDMLSPADYALSSDMMSGDAASHRPATVNIYRRYQERLHAANAMDFDDLLLNTYILLRDFPDIRQYYQRKFRYILVDEYQDTNAVQQNIVLLLHDADNKICVVGDDSQSIYSFRGARISNILHFEQTVDGARSFKLEQNYRSTQTIVNAANSLIAHNQMRLPKTVFSANGKGEPITVQRLYDNNEEATFVVSEIQKWKRKEKSEYSDFAVLYRTNAQSRSIEQELRRCSVPYRIFSGQSFYQRAVILDCLAYFRLTVNPADDEALRRIINTPARGIGDTTVKKLALAAANSNRPLLEVALAPHEFGVTLQKRTLNALKAFTDKMVEWQQCADTEDAYQLGNKIITASGMYMDAGANKTQDDIARQDNIEELVSALNEFVEMNKKESEDYGETEPPVKLSDYLQEVTLQTDDEDDDTTQPKVSLMTIHSAKGLEFGSVFVVGVEENIFPSAQCSGSPREIEEERRLFYVAITRAERHCYITCAQNRFRYGKTEQFPPSRFIHEIDRRYLSINGITPDQYSEAQSQRPSYSRFANPYRQTARPATTASAAPQHTSLEQFLAKLKTNTGGSKTAEFKVGDTVSHPKFGSGEIKGVEGTGENTKVYITFKTAGDKVLLAKFAQLTRCE